MRSLRTSLVIVVALASVLAALIATMAAAAGHGRATHFSARLGGYQQVPSISTRGRGTFEARLSSNGRSIRWQLTYQRMSARVQQAHIHFAQPHVNGGISVTLCMNGEPSVNPAPPCPRRHGTLTGRIRAVDVIGPAAQGIRPDDFGALLRAMRAGGTYVNVHSARFPDGEIRGQIHAHRR
jgi:CHRD domain